MNTRLLKITSLALLLVLRLVGGATPAWAQTPLPGTRPTFSASDLLTSVSATMAVQADFNLDGNMDIAVTNELAGTVTILLGSSATVPFATPLGTQTVLPVPSNLFSHPISLAVGDFDKNGWPDLVVANKADGSVTFLKNTTIATALFNGTTSATRISTPTGPAQVAVADVDGDQLLDFVTANFNSNNVTVVFGDGAGAFSSPNSAKTTKTYAIAVASSPPAGTNPNSVVLTDLNRDSRPDLVVGGNNGSQLFVFINTLTASNLPNPDPYAPRTGPSAIANPTAYNVGALPVAVGAADMNGDLNPDVVVSNHGGFNGTPIISVLFGNGDGFLGTAPCSADCGPNKRLDIADVGQTPQGVVVGDINGDSYADIAVVDDSHQALVGVTIFLGNGLGCFGSITSCPPGWNKITLAAGAGPMGIGLGDVTNDGKPDLYVANTQAPGLTLFTNTLAGANASAALRSPPNARCISSPSATCVGMDVNLVGGPIDGNIRGYSVTLKLSKNLQLCIGDNNATGLLQSFVGKGADTYFQKGGTTRTTDLRAAGPSPDGVYTIDEVILNSATSGCGPAFSSGKLFSIYVAAQGNPPANDVGTVTVTGLILRNCVNDPITAFACPTASQGHITINPLAPLQATALSVRPNPPPNAAPPNTPVRHTIDITVSWVLPAGGPPAPAIDIFRAPFYKADNTSAYPDYQGTVPAAPSIAQLYPNPTLPWVKAGSAATGTSLSFTDTKANNTSRGYWYYAVVRVGDCGQPSAPLGPACDALSADNGTLNYYLGDVRNGGADDCNGDNKVDLFDFGRVNGLFSFSHLIPISPPNADACVDFGPTTAKVLSDGTTILIEEGRPTGKPGGGRDEKVESSEYFILGNSLNIKKSPQLANAPVAADRDELTLDTPSQVPGGGTFLVTARLKGAGDIHGIVAQLDWNHSVAELVSVESGELAQRQDAIVLTPPQEPGYLVALVPGRDHVGLLGDGVLATVKFRAKVSGDPSVSLASLDARDANFRQVLGLSGTRTTPFANEIAAASPNPFERNVRLRFSLATEGRADMAIYSVEGRRVKILASGTHRAGVYNLDWDGTDEGGREVGPGVYFVRLLTPAGRFARTLVRLK